MTVERYCRCGLPTRAATQSLCAACHAHYEWRRRYYAQRRKVKNTLDFIGRKHDNTCANITSRQNAQTLQRLSPQRPTRRT